jgi:2-oxo-3-hexenedioate decarboxylase
MEDSAGTRARLDDATLGMIAAEAFDAFNSGGRHVQSFAARHPDLTLDDAYRVTAQVNTLRMARGFKPIGRKIGFTNRRIWPEYNVFAPIWGYVYDRTLHDLAEPLPLSPYSEPKIEPEIMFGLSAAPSPGMDDAALLKCIDWVALGYEIVQSIFPEWKFTPPDTVAADALHAALLVGPKHPVRGREDEWLRSLTSFEVELYRDGKLMDRGQATNVMEGPLSTLRYMMDLLAKDRNNPPLGADEIVATGTLTRALPCSAGETWTTTLKGIALEGVSARFA